MAIAFGAITGASNSGTSLTFSSPDVSGSDTLGLVAYSRDADSSPVSGVTWNGSAMTLVDSQYNNFGGAGNTGVELWYILNPTAGVTNVVVSASSGANAAKAAFYTGVKQSGQPDATNTGSIASSSDLTISVTTIADNCWTVLVGRDVNSNTLTGVANATIRTPSTNNAIGFFDSNGVVTPAGSFSMTVGQSGAKNGVMASFAPVAAAGPANLKSYNTNLKANIKSINTNLIANVKSLNTNA